MKKIAENIERDKRKDAELKDLGWTILHFWEKDINKDLDRCVELIVEAIESAKAVKGNNK